MASHSPSLEAVQLRVQIAPCVLLEDFAVAGVDRRRRLLARGSAGGRQFGVVRAGGYHHPARHLEGTAIDRARLIAALAPIRCRFETIG